MSVELQGQPAPSHIQQHFDIDLATDPIQVGTAPSIPLSHPQQPTYTSIPPHPDTVTTTTDPVGRDATVNSTSHPHPHPTLRHRKARHLHLSRRSQIFLAFIILCIIAIVLILLFIFKRDDK